MNEYDVAYFQQINAEEAPQAERLADLLIWHYKPGSVIDVGCASGLYLKPFLSRGVKVTGIDYADSAVTDEVLQIPRKYIKIVDITKKPIGRKADLTICLEVLEHIAEKHADISVKRIAASADIIIFSAARPGQGGVGHINCQPKQYWDNLFVAHGLRRDTQDEEYIKTIMASGYHMGWLTNNLMIFKKTA